MQHPAAEDTRPNAVPLSSRAPASKDRTPDEDLVRWSVEGNRDSFEMLVRRHQRGVVNHLYRLVGRRDAALDLAQDVFIKVFQSLASFDPKFRFTTWLYRIASNSAIDHLRKRRVSTCSLSPEPEVDGRQATERNIPGPGPSPHDVLQYREIEARLEQSLATLPTGYRELIMLRHHRHCRYDEIARITGLPIGTVKNRIFRAREMLRHELADVLAAEA